MVRKAAVCQNGGCYYQGYGIKTKERVILKGKLRQLAAEDVLMFCEFKSSNKIPF